MLFLLTFLLKQGYLLNFNHQVTIIAIIMLLSVVFFWSFYKRGAKLSDNWLMNSKIIIALSLTFIMNVAFDGINFIPQPIKLEKTYISNARYRTLLEPTNRNIPKR